MGLANGLHENGAVPSQQKALVYDKPGTLSVRLEELAVPQPSTGEILINLTHSGVCHSDMAVMLEAWGSVAQGQVGGHEGVGKIAAFGPDTQRYTLKIGDRVGGEYRHHLFVEFGACPYVNVLVDQGLHVLIRGQSSGCTLSVETACRV